MRFIRPPVLFELHAQNYLLNELNSGGPFDNIFHPSVGVYQCFVSNGSNFSHSSAVVVPSAFITSGETNRYFCPSESTNTIGSLCTCFSTGRHEHSVITNTSKILAIQAINKSLALRIGLFQFFIQNGAQGRLRSVVSALPKLCTAIVLHGHLHYYLSISCRWFFAIKGFRRTQRLQPANSEKWSTMSVLPRLT